MELEQYLEECRELVEEGLREFIHARYQDDMMELAAYMAMGGKRLRGMLAVLSCEAVGGDPKDALVAACAVELCQAASLVKDDVMDQDEERRGKPSFWKRFGMGMALLLPDVIVPHAAMFTQAYGARALVSVIDAWARLARGQLLDSPPTSFFDSTDGDYERIIGLKTAPLFEVACELGVRASRKDWLINTAKLYGFNTGMAFQVYDDACDLLRAEGQPWESVSKGKMPVTLRALKARGEGGDLITIDDYTRTLDSAWVFLNEAERAADAFPDTEVKNILKELPSYCCNVLLEETKEAIAEAKQSKSSRRAPGVVI